MSTNLLSSGVWAGCCDKMAKRAVCLQSTQANKIVESNRSLVVVTPIQIGQRIMVALWGGRFRMLLESLQVSFLSLQEHPLSTAPIGHFFLGRRALVLAYPVFFSEHRTGRQRLYQYHDCGNC